MMMICFDDFNSDSLKCPQKEMKLKTESPVKKEMNEDNTDDDGDDDESEDEWEDVEGNNCTFIHFKHFLRACISQ